MKSPDPFQIDIARALLAIHSTLIVVVDALPAENRSAVYGPLDELMNRIGSLVARLDAESDT